MFKIKNLSLLMLAAVTFASQPLQSSFAQKNCRGYRDRADQGKVVGGWVATNPSDWPGISVLRLSEPNGKRRVYLCGGTLIDSKWIVTAAHCADLLEKNAAGGYVAKDIYLQLAGWFVNVKGWSADFVHNASSVKDVSAADQREIEDVLIRQGYQSPERTGNDIALISLKASLGGSVMPLSLDANTDPTPTGNGDVMVAGFGYRSEGQGVEEYRDSDGYLVYAGSDVLREVGIPLVSEASCKSAYPSAKVGQGQVCAGLNVGTKDSCQGDSGGPLVSFDADGCPFQIGVVSWGRGCAKQNAYGIYTRISEHKDWIREHVADAKAVDLTRLRGISALRSLNGLINQLHNIVQPKPGDLKLNVKLKDEETYTTNSDGSPILTEGQRALFEVESKLSGKLVLIDINPKGQVTQIYPSVKAPSSEINATHEGQKVLAPNNNSWFRIAQPDGMNKLVGVVVPEDFPVRALQDIDANGTAKSKGLVPEDAPNNYLSNLISDIDSYVKAKKTDLLKRGLIPEQGGLWSMAVLDYEIRKP